MLDIKAIREDPEPFRTGLARRNLAEAVDQLLAADERRRALTVEVDDLRAAQNKASKAIGRASGDEKQALISEVSAVSAAPQRPGAATRGGRGAVEGPPGRTPNVPSPDSPDGFTDEDAVEVRRNHDEPPAFDFEVRDHAELGGSSG